MRWISISTDRPRTGERWPRWPTSLGAGARRKEGAGSLNQRHSAGAQLVSSGEHCGMETRAHGETRHRSGDTQYGSVRGSGASAWSGGVDTRLPRPPDPPNTSPVFHSECFRSSALRLPSLARASTAWRFRNLLVAGCCMAWCGPWNVYICCREAERAVSGWSLDARGDTALPRSES